MESVCVCFHPQSPILTARLFNSRSAVRSHTRLLSVWPVFDPAGWPAPRSPRGTLLYTIPLTAATQMQKWWAVQWCSMFSSTFKVPPAVSERCKNRSTAQRYCFLLPCQFEGKSGLLILAYPPNFACESWQIVNNRRLIKAICCELTVMHDKSRWWNVRLLSNYNFCCGQSLI